MGPGPGFWGKTERLDFGPGQGQNYLPEVDGDDGGALAQPQWVVCVPRGRQSQVPEVRLDERDVPGSEDLGGLRTLGGVREKDEGKGKDRESGLG